MHNVVKFLILGSLFASPIAAVAQTAATLTPAAVTIKEGKLLKSSDGRRLGRIDQLDKAKDGTLTTAELFTSSGILYVPVATISSPDGANFVTSMSYAEVMKGK
ncbi:MAG: hypothetical protein JWO65_1107 [Sphingomonas bacterium]|nr:hypothetical protein [Sphingomonas bacterium]